jgi:hypothetical protein
VHADAVARAPDRRRLIELTALGLAVGLVVAILVIYFERGFIPGDAFTYLGAGERLNAGHALYALVPSDRQVGIDPPFWTVPLLSPPPIAVLFRPLAALPSELGVYLWWALDVVAVALALGLMARRRPILVAIGIVVFSIPLVYEIGVGNMNGLVLLGLVLTWRATVTGNERVAGVLTGLMAAFKITPAVLGWWLLTARRWSAVAWAVGAGLIVLAISLLGAGLDAHLRYLGVIRETAVLGARPLSLAGMALFVGVPAGIANLLPTVALAIGVAATALLRKRPDLAFVATILAMVFGSPTVSINWFIYLLACLAPIVWPWRERVVARVATPLVEAETSPA